VKRKYVSRLFPKYAVTIYPYARYKSGSGWFIHEDGDESKSISGQELAKMGSRDVYVELSAVAKRIHDEDTWQSPLGLPGITERLSGIMEIPKA